MTARVSLSTLMTATLAMLLMFANVTAAQPPSKPAIAEAAAKGAIVTLMVEVTISRLQGDKRTSSLPYTIAVTPGDRSTLRIGGEVAIPSTTFTPSPPSSAAKEGTAAVGGGEAKPSPLTSYSYRNIGTNIDLTASALEDGRYRISIVIDESSIYPPGEAAKNMTTVAGAPAFRFLRSNNSVVLRDGQSIDYTAATDRITGEVARISVRLTVAK